MTGSVLALVLSILLVASLIPAFAAGENNFKLTINNTVKDHTYTAYQIFKGTKADHSATKSLGDVEWGSDITTAGKKALYDAYNMEVAETDYNKSENILALMEKIADKDGTDSESDKAVKVANIFFETATNGQVTAKTGLLNAPAASQAIKATGETVEFTGLSAGYYLVNDSYTAANGEVLGKDYSIARIAVQVVGDTTINNKADKPTVDKKIHEDANNDGKIDDGELKDNNGANIGDTVNYVVNSVVPEYSGYEEYYMDFSDTLSKGLTFTKTGGTQSGVTVKIGETTLATDAFTVTVGDYDATNGTSIAIHLKDLVSRNYTVGAPIVITYSAVLNKDAVIGVEGNPNTVKLKYSNNPLNSGDGKPDEGDDGTVNGETPESTVRTFVTGLKVVKVDPNGNRLSGATFKLSGDLNKINLYTADKFVEASDGEYYLLKDGSYTTTNPTGSDVVGKDNEDDLKAQYVNPDGSKKYKKTTVTYTETEGTGSPKSVTGTTDSKGVLIFDGLAAGDFTLVETEAPKGYNTLTTEIKFQVEWKAPTGTSTDCEWEVVNKTSGYNMKWDANANEFVIAIENNAGTQLPSTGGIGTTVFYVAGSILVLAAAILLITKRRMGAND